MTGTAFAILAVFFLLIRIFLDQCSILVQSAKKSENVSMFGLCVNHIGRKQYWQKTIFAAAVCKVRIGYTAGCQLGLTPFSNFWLEKAQSVNVINCKYFKGYLDYDKSND